MTDAPTPRRRLLAGRRPVRAAARRPRSPPRPAVDDRGRAPDARVSVRRPTTPRSTTPRRSAPTCIRVERDLGARSRRPPTSSKRPKGFDGEEPRRLPGAAVGAATRSWRGAQARGLKVLLSPSGPIPVWASQAAARLGLQADPRSRRVQAAIRTALRRLRARGRHALPDASSRWSIWNEPNLRRVADAAVRGRGRPRRPDRGVSCTARSRASAISGLRATGHDRDRPIWLGETAPIGDDPSGCAPSASCARPRSCAGQDRRPPRRRSCAALLLAAAAAHRAGPALRGFKRLSVTGFAHHPYTRGGSRPPTTRTERPVRSRSASRRGCTRCSTRRARAKRIPAKLPIFYTEHGLQTNPPDHDLRRAPSPAGRLHQPVRLDGLPQRRGAHDGAVQDRRRREHRLELPDGPAR